jgi:hypothetical protein
MNQLDPVAESTVEGSSPPFVAEHRERVHARGMRAKLLHDRSHCHRQLLRLRQGHPYSGGV